MARKGWSGKASRDKLRKRRSDEESGRSPVRGYFGASIIEREIPARPEIKTRGKPVSLPEVSILKKIRPRD